MHSVYSEAYVALRDGLQQAEKGADGHCNYSRNMFQKTYTWTRLHRQSVLTNDSNQEKNYFQQHKFSFMGQFPYIPVKFI